MSIFRKISRLFFPPRCLACRTLMRIDEADRALCPKCAPQWRRALHTQCKHCFLPYFDCRCVKNCMERVGIGTHVKLVPYDEAGREPAASRRMILKMKQSNHTPRFAFVAKELSVGIRHTVEKAERKRQSEALLPLETVITYVPRSAQNMLGSGVDQSRQLALALSRTTGFPVKRAIGRKNDRVQQKHLSRLARAKNMRGVLFAKEDVLGLRVLLVDDIVTTGVTMSEAARLLYEAGAAEVIAVSVASAQERA